MSHPCGPHSSKYSSTTHYASSTTELDSSSLTAQTIGRTHRSNNWTHSPLKQLNTLTLKQLDTLTLKQLNTLTLKQLNTLTLKHLNTLTAHTIEHTHGTRPPLLPPSYCRARSPWGPCSLATPQQSSYCTRWLQATGRQVGSKLSFTPHNRHSFLDTGCTITILRGGSHCHAGARCTRNEKWRTSTVGRSTFDVCMSTNRVKQICSASIDWLHTCWVPIKEVLHGWCVQKRRWVC